MRIEDIDLENATSEEFTQMVQKMLKQVDNFIQRGEDELGLKIARIMNVNVADDTREGMHSLQMMRGSKALFEQAFYDNNEDITSLAEIGMMYNDVAISNLIEALENDDDE